MIGDELKINKISSHPFHIIKVKKPCLIYNYCLPQTHNVHVKPYSIYSSIHLSTHKQHIFRIQTKNHMIMCIIFTLQQHRKVSLSSVVSSKQCESLTQTNLEQMHFITVVMCVRYDVIHRFCKKKRFFSYVFFIKLIRSTHKSPICLVFG